MPPTLEEVVYALARAGLDEQRELATDLRASAAPVLAGGAALAALLARPAIADGVSFVHRPVHAGLVCAGIAGAVTALVGSLLVLAAWDLAFAVDPARLYADAYRDRDRPGVYLIRIAEAHRVRQESNVEEILRIHRCLAGGRIGVVLELVGFALALAVH
jgi:hypothetical protein